MGHSVFGPKGDVGAVGPEGEKGPPGNPGKAVGSVIIKHKKGTNNIAVFRKTTLESKLSFPDRKLEFLQTILSYCKPVNY